MIHFFPTVGLHVPYFLLYRIGLKSSVITRGIDQSQVSARVPVALKPDARKTMNQPSGKTFPAPLYTWLRLIGTPAGRGGVGGGAGSFLISKLIKSVIREGLAALTILIG